METKRTKTEYKAEYKMEYSKEVECYGVQEIVCEGPADGNPFTDYSLCGTFYEDGAALFVDGFYDGNGIYKIRFMPSVEGQCRFVVKGNFIRGEREGVFEVTPPREGNHGPVRVADTFHFAYADKTPYYPIGTTCYVWELQTDERIAQTLETLKGTAFNKIRFCIFPKHYDYNLGEPRSYPYEGTPMDSSVLTRENFWSYTGKTEGNRWDFSRFCPEHFSHIEKCILELQKLGIEADLIVMHPYDRWGFSSMDREADDLYWNYVLARFSSFRNVWWSLANEYDLMQAKKEEDWEHFGCLIQEKDIYHHLCSIHNCGRFFDYTRPWITHCSIQTQELAGVGKTNEWREKWRKPVVIDEMAYEGDIQHEWGSITAQEMVRRFWEAICRGGYPGHGETYQNPENILWWSHGGRLCGESHERFALLLDILRGMPEGGLSPVWINYGEVAACTRQKDFYLIYYSFLRPAFKEYHFDDTTKYRLSVIDTWEMTVEERGIVSGKFRVELPAKQYMAVRLEKVETDKALCG